MLDSESMMDEKTIRCVECRGEFSDAETANAAACPQCGNPGLPMAIKEDVTVTINWHELRILCMWASNFASSFKGEAARSQKGLATIIRTLRAQHPELSGLTMAEDIQEVADAFNRKVTEVKGGVWQEFKPKRGVGS